MKYLLLYATVVFQIFKLNNAGNPILRKRDLRVRNRCAELYLEILVSPLVSKTEVRSIEVQWEYAPLQEGDWIGLFVTNPEQYYAGASKRILPPLVDFIVPNFVHGWQKTRLQENHLDSDELGYRSRCLSYFAVYFNRYNETLTWSCLRVEPNWMWDLRQQIGDKRLREVFIPGTHDTASYDEYNPDLGDTRVKKYSVTQDERVEAQLLYGARYIDLRVGYYKNQLEPWWGNHGIIKFHPLRIIFNDTKKFLDKTNEIVIIDIQEFTGFKDAEVHKYLVEFIVQELGDYIASPRYGWEATLNDIWNSRKRLIISYDNAAVVQMYPNILFPNVQQKWGNVRRTGDLYNYLSGVIERPPFVAWAAMAELTPNTLDVILDRLGGLRKMAEGVNHNVTEWFRSANWAPKTNIVSVDFIRGSGIVRAAIEWNKSNGLCNIPRSPINNNNRPYF